MTISLTDPCFTDREGEEIDSVIETTRRSQQAAPFYLGGAICLRRLIQAARAYGTGLSNRLSRTAG
jgi:hypothetical protein